MTADDDHPDADSRSAASSVKSARRVFEVLEFFDQHRRAASAIEVASALGYPQSSTSMLMRTMTSLGYLHYDSSQRTYMPTVRVALLGQWLDGPLLRDRRLLGLMQDLSARTGETIILAARNGLQAQYQHVIQATVPARLYVEEGSFRPLTRSGTGKALLSALPNAQIARLVARINAEEANPEWRVPLEAIMAEVATIRERGYSVSYNQVTPGAGIVSALLPVGPHLPPLVVGIAGVAEQVRQSGEERAQLLLRVIEGHELEPRPD